MTQDFKISRFRDFKISRFQDFKISSFQDFNISICQDFKISRFQDFKMSRFQDFRISRVQYLEILNLDSSLFVDVRVTSSFLFVSNNPHTANGTVRCTKRPSAAGVD